MPGRKDNRTSEPEISVAVLRICADSLDGTASIRQLKKLIPDYINLTPEDHAPSTTRKGEELWEQIVRNIVSHGNKKAAGNILTEGYAEHSPGKITITKSGRTHLKNMGY
jgi:IS5 family transposase